MRFCSGGFWRLSDVMSVFILYVLPNDVLPNVYRARVLAAF